MTTVVKIEDLSKRFIIRKDKSLKERVVNFGRSQKHKEEFWALRDINLEIASGSTIGLIGPNGSGKSTLLKMIGGILEPNTGSVMLRGRLAALLELGAGFHPDLTGRENVYLNASILGLSVKQTDQYFDAIVDFSGIEKFIDTQVKFYSSGMYVRLAFAVAIHVDPDILLVDEVLAVGDEPFQRKCMERIRQFQHDGRTIILVSHALEQVGELCDRAVVLEHGRILADGEPKIALRALRNEFEEMRQEEIERLQERETDPANGYSPAVPPRAKIAGLQLAGHTGQEHPILRPGDDLTVQIDVDAQERLNSWVIGISLETVKGQGIFGTTTKRLGVDPGTLIGRGSYSFDLPRLTLGSGEYMVSAAIALKDGTEIHRVQGACSFAVDAGERSTGITYVDATFSRAAG